jgi:hypothetical protein
MASIANCQLPISTANSIGNRIGNRQSQIGNDVTWPFARASRALSERPLSPGPVVRGRHPVCRFVGAETGAARQENAQFGMRTGITHLTTPRDARLAPHQSRPSPRPHRHAQTQSHNLLRCTLPSNCTFAADHRPLLNRADKPWSRPFRVLQGYFCFHFKNFRS